MSDYLKRQAAWHKVEHEYSGKEHWFRVKSGKTTYSVSIHANCDCKFMGVSGIAHGRICSHVLAALRYIWEKGGV